MTMREDERKSGTEKRNRFWNGEAGDGSCVFGEDEQSLEWRSRRRKSGRDWMIDERKGEDEVSL
ncbi:putative VPS10 domain-containing receptor SorCS1-like [Sesbania bispinosa]|nr:putative VPS10 domain-containing receptor SorCS1-like [Sesbania bispinosa]